MTDLPAGLADPLHILEPWPWQRAAVVAALAAALLLLWWLWRRRSADRQEREELVAPPPPSPFDEAVARILSRAHGSRDYRTGCHELATLLRSGLEPEHGSRVQTLTARELAERFGDRGLTRLLLLLSELRFERRSVGKRDLEGACELALETRSRSRGGEE